MTQRKIAIITGIALLLMAVIAGFSLGYAYNQFYQLDALASVKDHILQDIGLYKNMLFGLLGILLLDYLVSYTLFKYFENDNKTIALASGGIRLVYTLIFSYAVYFLVQNLNSTALSNEEVLQNFDAFQTVWYAGLIIFGLHLLLIGVLMKLHLVIPKILWYLTIFAGIAYLVLHIFKLTTPDSPTLASIEMILALPMALGELCLAVWLLVKGGKVGRKIEI